MSAATDAAAARLLISADELAAAIARGDAVRVLDVRWRLDVPDGRPAYLRGHIPTAVYVDLDDQLAAHGRPATEGRHPLPTIADLQDAARSWGIDDGDTVVVYDDLKNLSSARAWWLLRHAGIADVRVLDGSLRAWVAAGHPLEEGSVVPAPGNVVLEYGTHAVLSPGEAAEWADAGALLDVRAHERYTGDTEPIDPRAGHIPGARSAPTTGNVDAEGRFLEAAALRARFAEAGVPIDRPVGAYCGSGVTASHTVLALALAGVDAALYPGSWSQWSNLDRPIATGTAP